MWSYYGTKTKLAELYPAPKHDTIIEPFAGAAAYSLFGYHWQRNVILRDVNPKVIRLWLWLRDRATPELIRCLPQLEPGQPVPDHLPTEARWLVAFSSNQGTESPRNVANRGNFCQWTARRERIAESLHKIRHWDIALARHDSLPNIKATWFVDPPYQHGGRYRYCERVDYPALADWCRTRRGQVIVCENEGADWLPFSPLAELEGRRARKTELVYVQPGV